MSSNLLRDGKIESTQMLESLSAEEGFVMSRCIKGMSLSELKSLLPWPEEQVEAILQNLIEKGALSVEQPPQKPKAPKVPKHLESVLDEDSKSTNLDFDFCAEILLKADDINSKSPYEILELGRNASLHEIKNQYLALSKRYHPDRFFRKDLGPFKDRLNLIFSKLQKAYTTLKDPHEREVIDRMAAKDKAIAEPPSKPKVQPKSKEEMLKKLKALDPQFEKMAKAEDAFKDGQKKEKEGDYIGALNSYTLAIQLCPDKPEFKKSHDHVLPLSAKQKAERRSQEAGVADKARMIEDVFKSADEALKLDPNIPEAQFLWSKAVIELKLEEYFRPARERLLRSKASLSKNPEPCFWLAKLLVITGDSKSAKKELQEALQRDPRHSQAKKLLEEI